MGGILSGDTPPENPKGQNPPPIELGEVTKIEFDADGHGHQVPSEADLDSEFEETELDDDDNGSAAG